MKEECKNCKYYKPKYGFEGSGYCKRYPPKIIQFTEYQRISIKILQPVVSEKGWCGEWKEREE
jgi:hypothetical protein